MNTIQRFLLIGSITLFVSCQKEVSQPVDIENVAGSGIQAVSSRITGGDWKFTSVRLEYSNGEISEGDLDDCKSDDLYRYESNGEASVLHGAIPCFVDPGDGKFASWELLKDGRELREIYIRDILGENAGNVVVYKVEFISDHKLIISRIVTDNVKTFTEFNTYKR